jgi:hypothetical protein
MTDLIIRRTGKDKVGFEAITEAGRKYQDNHHSLHEETNMVAGSMWAKDMADKGLRAEFIS